MPTCDMYMYMYKGKRKRRFGIITHHNISRMLGIAIHALMARHQKTLLWGKILAERQLQGAFEGKCDPTIDGNKQRTLGCCCSTDDASCA